VGGETSPLDDLKRNGEKLQQAIEIVRGRMVGVRSPRLKARLARELAGAEYLFVNSARMLGSIDGLARLIKKLTGASVADIFDLTGHPARMSGAMNIGAALMAARAGEMVDVLHAANLAIDRDEKSGAAKK
jgi:hypothetical protein